MTEWWTYRPDDLLLYSARTYYRLFELYHQDIWPAQIVALLAGVLLTTAILQPGPRAARIAAALLAASWAWVAWAFHFERFSTIHWMARAFAAAFAVQAALLLLAWALCGAAARPRPAGLAGRWAGAGLIAFAALGYPVLAPLAGRPWLQAEVFALMPDPTALATLGWLLVTPTVESALSWRRWLAAARWPIPLAWCGYTATMLAVMGSPEAWVLASAMALLVIVGWRGATRDASRRRSAAP